MSPIQFDRGAGTGPQPSSSIRLSRSGSALRHAGPAVRVLLFVSAYALLCAPSAVHGQTVADLLRRVGESKAESSSRTDSPPVVGDVILEMEFVAGGRDSRLLRSSEVDLTVVGEGRVLVRDELASLTLLRRPALPPGGTGVALPWSEARALLAQVLAHRVQMAETLPSLLHAVKTDDGTVYVPQPFVSFIRPGLEGPLVTVPSGSQNPFDIRELSPLRGGELPFLGATPAGSEVPDEGATPPATLLWNRDARRKLYAEAALRAVALDEAKRYDHSLVGVLASSRSEAPTLLGVADAVASAGLDVNAELRRIPVVPEAVRTAASTRNVVSSGQAQVSSSWVGRSAQGLGVLALGVDFAQRFTDERSRNRILAAAAEDARIILGLENAQRLLAATGGDPAMIDGLSDAVETLIELSRSRFEETVAAAADAFVGSIPALAQVAAGYVVSGGAALVFQQAGALVADLDDYGHAVLAVSAMTTMGEALRSRVESLLSGNQDGDVRPTDYAVREIVGLQRRLAAEATASVYSMLWRDRWSGATTLGGMGRGIGLTLAEWFTGDEHTRRGFEAAMRGRVGQVRTAAMFDAHLPDTLVRLRRLYSGPMDAAKEQPTAGAGGEFRVPDEIQARSTDCTGWGTPEFFSHAEPGDIDRCIQHGADPNARVSIPWDEGFTLDGVTMLHLAAMQSDHAGVIRALLEGGAQSDVRVDGDYEATPLHWAAEYSDNPAVVRVFLEGGADVGVRNETGRTPLHLAVWGAARPDVVRMLLAGGADPNAGDEFVDTPLHLAVAWSDEPRVIVEALLENGADPNARGRYGQTPLHEAVSFEEFSHSAQGRRDPAVVIRLLDAGASIHARTVSGWTPLHTAASTQGHRYVREIIETLLDRGADPAEVNSNGQTAADLAEDNPELRGTSVHARLRRGASE